MKRTNRRTASTNRRHTWPLWLAALVLPGLAACNLKGDPAGYLRRGQASKEPVTSATSPTASPAAPSVAIAQATSPVASTATPTTATSAGPNGGHRSYAAAPATSTEPRSSAVPPTVEPPAPKATHFVAAAPTAPSAHPVAAPPSSSSPSPPINGKRNVSIGSAAVSGGTISNAARVVAGLRAPLRACYSAATTSGQGSLRFTINVGKTGAVTSASAQRSGELSNDLVACATGVVKAAKFDPPEYGAATLKVPATFVVQ